MGFPAFIKPRLAISESDIASNPLLSEQAEDPTARLELLNGHVGEIHWHRLPENLRKEIERFESEYVAPPEGELDGPCAWLDLKTRQCRHHEYRPNVCRDFEMGSADCLDWRRFYLHQIRENVLQAENHSPQVD